MKFPALLLSILLAFVASPAAAETARDILMGAAFTPTDKATALASIERALKSADAALTRNPADQEARLQRALAISYRGKLTRSRTDIMTARKAFEAVLSADPRSAEANMAVAGWHLGAVIELGPMVAGTMLGARKGVGLKALDRSVALGGNRAFFPAIACLHRIQVDPKDVAGALRLAEAAAKASADTPADRLMQRYASILLGPLRKGDGVAAAKAAKVLLPFGRLR